MTSKIYARIENQEGPVEGPLEDGRIQILQYDSEILVPTKKKQKGSCRAKPVQLVFDKGPHSPVLLKTLCEGQVCPKVELSWNYIDSEGAEDLFYTLTLHRVHIIRMKDWTPLIRISGQENVGYLESISIVAEEYSWLFEPRGIAYTYRFKE